MDESKPKKAKEFFHFGNVATILGFIVDTVAIVSILLSINIPSSGFVLPKYVLTPGFAFAIWAIATYAYFAILHSYWERKNEGNSFKEFLSGLILKFSKPIALFPGFILLVLLIWIFFLEPAIFGIVFGVSIFSLIVASSFYDTFGDDIERKKAKGLINQNWPSLKKQIKQRLADKVWLDPSDLADIANLWEINSKHFDYAFAKYAAENSSSARYACIYARSNNKSVSGTDNVLVNIENLNEEKYFLFTKGN